MPLLTELAGYLGLGATNMPPLYGAGAIRCVRTKLSFNENGPSQIKRRSATPNPMVAAVREPKSTATVAESLGDWGETGSHGRRRAHHWMAGARSSSAGALERNNGRSGNSALPGRGFWWGKRTRAGALGRRGRGERLGWFVPLPDAALGNGDGAARHPYHRLVAPRLGGTHTRLNGPVIDSTILTSSMVSTMTQ